MRKAIFFAHDKIGAEMLNFVFQYFADDVAYVVVIDDVKSKDVLKVVINNGFSSSKIIKWDHYAESKIIHLSSIEKVNYFYLLWWPKIISHDLLAQPLLGTINTHPSLLPYCRGKDPNFWTFIDNTPFGVSIHEVGKGIDDGRIISQMEIPKSWEDNGQSLYLKSLIEMLELFKRTYPEIRKQNHQYSDQNLEVGKLHYRKELDSASQIFLDKTYKAKDLINLLRARTFPPNPGCYFWDKDEKFEIRINIKKI
jgi:methionyl-tRNA formyltransferase